MYLCRIIKFAWERSIKPFDTVAKVLLVPVSMVGIFVILNFLTEEKGNYMIWLSIALPGVAFLIYFLWNLINVHHQTHRKWAHKFAFVLILLVMVLLTLFIEAIIKINRLEKPQVSEIIATIPATNKPIFLPEKIIPTPEPPSTPIVSTQQIASVEPQKQFETNAPDIGDAESELAKSRADKLANLQKLKLNVQAAWTNNLPIFNSSLEALHEILTKEATKRGDGIAKTVAYFQCLPAAADFEISGETNVAEIKLQTETNLDFKIAITGQFLSGENIIRQRGLRIYCSCGFLAITPRAGNYFNLTIHIPDGNENKSATSRDVRDIITQSLKILVGSQIDYLSKTNRAP
jgi:hypothetical protein